MLPPALTRVAFGGPSGSAKSNSHLAASRTVEQLKSLLTKASASSCFSGQLTDAGKLMMVELGHELRELYVEKQRFLPQVLDSRTARSIYLRSTDYLRTIESLQFLVHGLYPPLKRQAPNALNLQIHVRPHSDETMYPHDDCATLAVEIKRFRDAFRANNARRLQTTLAKFPTLTRAFDGTNLSDMNKIFRIYDALQSLDGNGLPLPPGVTKEHIKELSDLVIDQWGRAFTSKDAVASLAVGRFFPELAAPLVAAARGDPKATKMSIFSGHDT
nr:hypothetical protein HK105_008054 [Polyrhizophydium stewartii]